MLSQRLKNPENGREKNHIMCRINVKSLAFANIPLRLFPLFTQTLPSDASGFKTNVSTQIMRNARNPETVV